MKRRCGEVLRKKRIFFNICMGEFVWGRRGTKVEEKKHGRSGVEFVWGNVGCMVKDYCVRECIEGE